MRPASTTAIRSAYSVALGVKRSTFMDYESGYPSWMGRDASRDHSFQDMK